jgi:hypothetical protein
VYGQGDFRDGFRMQNTHCTHFEHHKKVKIGGAHRMINITKKGNFLKNVGKVYRRWCLVTGPGHMHWLCHKKGNSDSGD